MTADKYEIQYKDHNDKQKIKTMTKLELDIKIGEDNYTAKVEYSMIFHEKESCELGYCIEPKHWELDELNVKLFDYEGGRLPYLEEEAEEIIWDSNAYQEKLIEEIIRQEENYHGREMHTRN